tara:strand:- start:894 stop:1010 length:117 start_codon:yes stop_codon:yes gene_type:complete
MENLRILITSGDLASLIGNGNDADTTGAICGQLAGAYY